MGLTIGVGVLVPVEDGETAVGAGDRVSGSSDVQPPNNSEAATLIATNRKKGSALLITVSSWMALVT
ncbi:MAG: hypothetical protein O2888_02400 [Chloroflexi bacterium]|nr:hypothetical protein [Chloroflexota bacterium]